MNLKNINVILLLKIFTKLSMIIVIILFIILLISLFIFGEDKVIKFLEKYENIFNKMYETSKKQDDEMILIYNYFKYLFLSIFFRLKKNRD